MGQSMPRDANFLWFATAEVPLAVIPPKMEQIEAV
jgi:hypothetical protein